jgi:Flp pilus assembly protein TadG
MIGRRLHREDGASAVEFALIVPLLVIFVFGIIEFGIAFLQVQSIRTGVREGGRAAAVGAPMNTARQKTVDGSAGTIPTTTGVSVSKVCTPQNIGTDVTVSYDTQHLPEGGIVIQIPFVTDVTYTPVITANFRCEV